MCKEKAAIPVWAGCFYPLHSISFQ